MSDNKTKATAIPVASFLDTVGDERKRTEAQTLIDMMTEITGEEPVMWGPSIIGFGTYRYAYPSGRTGECNRLGFSPRKAKHSIYFLDGFGHYTDELARLGKHETGQACLYVKRLGDIDLDVLRGMLAQSNERLLADSIED